MKPEWISFFLSSASGASRFTPGQSGQVDNGSIYIRVHMRVHTHRWLPVNKFTHIGKSCPVVHKHSGRPQKTRNYKDCSPCTGRDNPWTTLGQLWDKPGPNLFTPIFPIPPGNSPLTPRRLMIPHIHCIRQHICINPHNGAFCSGKTHRNERKSRSSVKRTGTMDLTGFNRNQLT